MSKALDMARELVRQLEEVEKSNKVQLSELEVGDIFNLVGLNWKILDITGRGYMCLADKLENVMEFDSESSNWSGSQLREYLNTEFIEGITEEIGEENIILFNRILLSIDGQTEYGECEDKVSLLTIDEYREYRSLIPNMDSWWWLITPWSTPCNNNYNNLVVGVTSSGTAFYGPCSNYNCVHPLCVLKSNIIVSKGE